MTTKVVKMLAQAGNLLLVSHQDPDPDAIGASLGLAHLLWAMGKNAVVYSAGPIPDDAAFLPGCEKIINHEPKAGDFDLAVLLDCHEPSRAGKLAESFLPRFTKSLVIDHHLGEAGFGDHTWIDPNFAATAEMIAKVACDENWEITPDAATCLFTGIQTDTGCFCYSNTTERTFALASYLVKAKANPWFVTQKTYPTRPNRIKLQARVMDNMEILAQGRLAMAVVLQKDIKDFSCKPEDIDQVVETLRLIKGVEASCLLKERQDGTIRISMRSRGKVNVADAALQLGGGGHKNAAGAQLQGSVAQALDKMKELLLPMMEQ